MLRNLNCLRSTLTSKLIRATASLLMLGSITSSSVWAQGMPPQRMGMQPGQGGPIQLTQGSATTTTKSSKPKRPLPFPIEKQPSSTEELEIIHHRSQLMVTRAPIARIAIADPSIIDVVQYSPTEISVIGLQVGTTELSLWFDKQAEPLIYLVEIIRDPSWDERLRTDFGKLEKQLQILFPNSKVYLIPLQNRLVVKGQARDEEDAANIMQLVQSFTINRNGGNGDYANGGGGSGGGGGGYGNNNNGNNNNNNNNNNVVDMLEVPGSHQIMLHVKIAELSRGQLRRLGVDFEVLFNGGDSIGTTLAAGGATLTGILANQQVTMLLDWLSSNRTSKVLAAPTLTVLSGHEASFLSGGEFPVPTVVGVGGAQGTSTSFRGYGTSVVVRPQIIDRDWVQMEITPELSSIDGTGAGGVPSLQSRRVTTTVRLREGQTIVLAGLFGHTTQTNVARIPFLGELPLIGPFLFNSKNSQNGENELIIMVTPELVRPMEPDEVPPLPGFYVTTPNDIELYQYAKTEGYPDQGVYQLNPYGWGPGYASEVGYRPYNPAAGGSAFGSGGGSLGAMGGGGMTNFGGPAAGGYGQQQQQSMIYPGPPPGQPNPAMAPAMPGNMQPMPDPSMGRGQPSSPIQQMSYEQPRSSWMPWSRNRGAEPNSRNPAMLPTNATSPSLQNGNDGRLGQDGNRRQVQPQRSRY